MKKKAVRSSPGPGRTIARKETPIAKRSIAVTVGARRRYKARRSREELQARVFEAATSLFAQYGYFRPTIREIARRAKVPLPVLYRAARSKRALYAECCFRIAQQHMDHLQDAIKDFTDPAEILLVYIHAGSVRHNDIKDSRILHRAIIDNDVAVLKKVAPIFFGSKAAQRVYRAITELVGEEATELKMLSIPSLLVGFSEHLPFWNLAARVTGGKSDSGFIALYVLETLFPACGSWADVAKRVGLRKEGCGDDRNMGVDTGSKSAAQRALVGLPIDFPGVL